MSTTTSKNPTYIGPFTLRSPISIHTLEKRIENGFDACHRALKKLPTPPKLVTKSKWESFAPIEREQKRIYAEQTELEQHLHALRILSEITTWIRSFNEDIKSPWYDTPIHMVQSQTFEELKTAGLFYKDFDSNKLKIGIHILREPAHETVDVWHKLFIKEKFNKAVIVIYLAPFPKNKEYKFSNPYSIKDVPNAIDLRINSTKKRLNGKRKPVAWKVSQERCSYSEAQRRYEKEAHLWEVKLRERLAALNYIHGWFKSLTELIQNDNYEDPWRNVPVHFVRERTFQRFVVKDKFYRYCDGNHIKVGIAMANDTRETRNILLNQKRERQCYHFSELTSHTRFSDVIILVCIPPIPKWPILKWD